ncbi:hypothetical protein LAZ67_4002151, partial [Cordylochernes scorpioides]
MTYGKVKNMKSNGERKNKSVQERESNPQPSAYRPRCMYHCPAVVYIQPVYYSGICCRYFAIVHPLESRWRRQSKSRAARILVAVWVTPCVVAAPFLRRAESVTVSLNSSYGAITRHVCYVPFSPLFRRAYYTFLFVAIYALPLLVIAGTCARIAAVLLKGATFHRQDSLRRKEAHRRKVLPTLATYSTDRFIGTNMKRNLWSQIAKMVSVVAVAFAISWTPYFLVSIVTQYQPVNYFEKHNYFFTMLCINLFAFVNSCVNPLIYVIMSSRIRNRCRRILSCGLPSTSGDSIACHTEEVRLSRRSEYSFSGSTRHPHSQSNNNICANYSVDFQIAKMVSVVAVAFAISWTPYFLVSIVTQYQPVNYFEKHNYFFTMLCINLFAFVNSCVNPLIYVIMSSRIRNRCRRILSCGLPSTSGDSIACHTEEVRLSRRSEYSFSGSTRHPHSQSNN